MERGTLLAGENGCAACAHRGLMTQPLRRAKPSGFNRRVSTATPKFLGKVSGQRGLLSKGAFSVHTTAAIQTVAAWARRRSGPPWRRFTVAGT
jgi:hypothetical protein